MLIQISRALVLLFLLCMSIICTQSYMDKCKSGMLIQISRAFHRHWSAFWRLPQCITSQRKCFTHKNTQIQIQIHKSTVHCTNHSSTKILVSLLPILSVPQLGLHTFVDFQWLDPKPKNVFFCKGSPPLFSNSCLKVIFRLAVTIRPPTLYESNLSIVCFIASVDSSVCTNVSNLQPQELDKSNNVFKKSNTAQLCLVCISTPPAFLTSAFLSDFLPTLISPPFPTPSSWWLLINLFP